MPDRIRMKCWSKTVKKHIITKSLPVEDAATQRTMQRS